MLIDPNNPAHSHVVRRLKEERIIWLTTVRRDGQPQTSPLWFTWDGETLLTYSQPNVQKIRNIENQPRVSLHLDGGGDGETVIIEGRARVDESAPPLDLNEAYMGKYGEIMPGLGYTAEVVAEEYSVPVRFTPERLRAW